MLGAQSAPFRQFGVGTGPIHFDEVACNGDEESLFDCPRQSDCDHNEDVGVICRKLEGKVLRWNP